MSKKHEVKKLFDDLHNWFMTEDQEYSIDKRAFKYDETKLKAAIKYKWCTYRLFNSIPEFKKMFDEYRLDECYVDQKDVWYIQKERIAKSLNSLDYRNVKVYDNYTFEDFEKEIGEKWSMNGYLQALTSIYASRKENYKDFVTTLDVARSSIGIDTVTESIVLVSITKAGGYSCKVRGNDNHPAPTFVHSCGADLYEEDWWNGDFNQAIKNFKLKHYYLTK